MNKKLVCLALVLALASVASAGDVSYTGPDGGSWGVATNWDPEGVPDSSSWVTVTDVEVILTGTSTIPYQCATGTDGTITVDGGTLNTSNTCVGNAASGAGTGVLSIINGGVINLTNHLTLADGGSAGGTLSMDSGSINGTGAGMNIWSWAGSSAINMTGGSINMEGGANLTFSPIAIDISGGSINLGREDGFALSGLSTIVVSSTGVINIADTDGSMVSYIQPLIDDTHISGAVSWNGSDMTSIVVPEPITIALMGLGGLFLRRRK